MDRLPFIVCWFVVTVQWTRPVTSQGVRNRLADELCNDGWVGVNYTINNRYSQHACLLVSDKVLSWSEALSECRQHSAHLLVLDDTLYNINNKLSVDTHQLILRQLQSLLRQKEFDSVWLGLRAENSKLVWEAQVPTVAHSTMATPSLFTWQPSPPDVTFGSCGALLDLKQFHKDNIGQWETPTQLQVSLTNCDEQLNFVCIKKPSTTQLYNTSECPTGWLGHYDIEHCYMVTTNINQSHQQAEQYCVQQGGHLATPTTHLENNLVSATLANKSHVTFWIGVYINQSSVTGTRLETQQFYIQQQQQQQQQQQGVGMNCVSVSVEANIYTWSATDCQQQLMSVCQKPRRQVGSVAISVHPTNKTVQFNDLLQHRLQCNATNYRLDQPVVWVQDDTIYLNNGLPPLGLELDLHRMPFKYFPAELQGFYRCEVWGMTGTRLRRVSSQAALFTFTDVVTLRGSATEAQQQQQQQGPWRKLRYKRAQERQYQQYQQSYSQQSTQRAPAADYDTAAESTVELYEEQTMVMWQGRLSQLVADSSLQGNIAVVVDRIRYNDVLMEDEMVREEMIEFSVYYNITNSDYRTKDALRKIEPTLTQSQLTALWRLYVNNRVYREVTRQLTSQQNDLTQYIIRRTDACTDSVIVVDDVDITFPVTTVSNTASSKQTCVYDGLPIAVGLCVDNFTLGAEWTILFLHNCADTQQQQQQQHSNVTDDLYQLYQQKLNTDNVDYVTSSLASLTSLPQILTPLDVAYAAAILNNIGQATTAPLTGSQVAENLLSCVDNLARVDRHTLSTAQNNSHSTSRIVSAVEALTDNIQLNSSTLTITRPSVAIHVTDLSHQPDSTWIYGIGVTGRSWSTALDFRYYDNPVITDNSNSQHDSESLIILSQEALNTGRALSEFVDRPYSGSGSSGTGDTGGTGGTPGGRTGGVGGKFRVSFSVYNSSELFTVFDEKQPIVNSLIISATVNKVNINNLTQPVTVRLRLLQQTAVLDQKHYCAYWDSTSSSWSTDDVITLPYTSNSSYIVCHSRHLTNFAVIAGFDLARDTTIARVLQVVSLIGLILSIIGLSLTILTQLMLYKTVRKSRSPMVLLHLSVALLAVDIIVLVGVDKTESLVGCKAVAALLLYFLLVSFAWMLIEAVLQYLRFVKVFDTYISHFMIKATIPAWLVPALIVATVAIVDTKVNLLRGPINYCWLAPPAFYFAFLLPLGIIMLTNLVFFTLIVKGLSCDRSEGLTSTQTKGELVKLQVFALIGCFLVMGLTWLFALFAVDRAALAMQVLFCVFNSLQGFLIFLFLIVREKSVRRAWCTVCRRCRRRAVRMSQRGLHPTAEQRFKQQLEQDEDLPLKNQTLSENTTFSSSRAATQQKTDVTEA